MYLKIVAKIIIWFKTNLLSYPDVMEGSEGVLELQFFLKLIITIKITKK